MDKTKADLNITFYKETKFKETPVGKIPEDWKIIKLKELVEFEKGRRPSRLFEKQDRELIPYLTAEYMRGNGTPQWCSLGDPNIVKVSKEDIIMIWDGSYSGYVFTGFEGALASTMVKILPEIQSLDALFLYYILVKSFPLLRGTTVGTGIPHVNKMVFENLPIQLPSLSEQKAIAHILSTIDEAIQKTNEIIEKTERLKRRLMQELLTRGIGHKEFKDTEIGRIPKEWRVVKLDEIFDIRVGGDLNKLNFSKERNEKYRFPIYSNSVENNGLYGYADTYQYPENCITVTARGTLGYAVPRFEKFNAIIRLLVLVPKKALDIVFMSEYINSKIKFRLEKTSIPQLTAPKIAKYRVPLPSLSEQQKIAEILSTVDKRLEVERKRKEKLERIKKSLTDLLLTGKIRVRT